MEQQLPEGNTKNLKKGRKKRNEMKKKTGSYLQIMRVPSIKVHFRETEN
jgi:hypothetical protein